MCQVKLIRADHRFISIPVGMAVFCNRCQTVSNSRPDQCGSCGSNRVLALAALIGAPVGPDPGPASACRTFPTHNLEMARAA